MKSLPNKFYRAAKFVRKHPIFVSLLYFCFYFPIFSLLEKYREPQYYVHCWLDDVLPFCEYFVIPYVMWFGFVPGMLLFFLKKDLNAYYKCCKVIFGGMTICLLIYFLFPTGLMIREPVANRNLCAALVNFLRGVDTPTNVCPSIHVSSTVGILLVLWRSGELRRYRKLRYVMTVLGVFICISTMLLDQHSVIDVISGFVLSCVLCGLVEEVPAEASLRVRKQYLH